MRVIGGRSRGRRLAAKLPKTVRPTSDRVRESIFDMLGSMGGVEGLRVADLFCGSGALGLEALSRGAATAVFVDHDPDALAAVRGQPRRRGPRRRAGNAGAGVAAGVVGIGRSRGTSISRCATRPMASDEWEALLAPLKADVVVIESATPAAMSEGWVVTKERRYGGTLVTVAQRSEASEAGS